MICPRCEFMEAYKVFEAEDRSWEIFRCPRCNFNWRSTEGEELTDPKQYNPRVRLNEKQIQELPPKPPVPPLRKPEAVTALKEKTTQRIT